MNHLRQVFKHHRVELIVLVALLGIAAFLRFYRISEYMTFLGDEGRDAIVIKNLLVGHHIPLLGPVTSVGNMYLGPLYYYLMAVSMAVFWLNPVAAAGMVALIGVVTVGLVYYLAKSWFGFLPAVAATLLYAVSPVTIIYSRSSWNPNPAPFFALLAIISLDRAHKSQNYRWFILMGAALAFAAQMHYLALILIPIILILSVYLVFSSQQKKHLFVGVLGAVAIFLLLMSPLVIFDLRHDFMNYKAVVKFFSNRETTVNLNPFNTLGRVFPIFTQDLISRYLAGSNLVLAILTSLLVVASMVISLFKNWQKKQQYWPTMVLGIWLVVGLLGLALYKQTIYDHYLGFLAPAPFLLLALLISNFNKKIQPLLVIILILVLGSVNIAKNPLQYPANKQLQRTQDIARFIISKTENKPFNFALIANSNYDSAYQYYLDLYGHKPALIQYNKTDQLFVVCEDKECSPVGHPKYEISAFGWTTIADEYDFNGIKVYKLITNPDFKNNQARIIK